MKVTTFNEKKSFSEASGTCAFVDTGINVELNEYGVYEEKVLSNNTGELNELVEFVSPNMNAEYNESEISRTLFHKVHGIIHDKEIGYYLSLYAGHVIEGDYREKASSGGMGTWIIKELFERKLIDGVLHVKENPDTSSSVLYQYDISRTIDEIKAGAKTKYYPVEYSRVLKIVKAVPGRYAIVGIPSFIMAIRLLSKKDIIINERIKFTIGLICGHQKSSKFAESFAWQMGIKPGNLKHIDFRKKLMDKPADNYGVEVSGIIEGKNVTIVKPTNDLLGHDWGQGYFKVYASDYTDDVFNETADITLGDAWLPEYTRDSYGSNIVIVRDPIFDEIIREGIESEKLKLDMISKGLIIKSQAAHLRHTRNELAYRLYKIDKAKKWRPKKRIEASNDIPLMRRKVQDMREEISSMSHIVYKKAVELDDLAYFKTEMGKLSNKYSRLYRLMSMQSMGITGIAKALLRKVSTISPPKQISSKEIKGKKV